MYPLIPANCPYSIKSIRTFRGMEGLGYSAVVCFNGKKIGMVIDDATGMMARLEDMVFEAERALMAYGESLPPYPAYTLNGVEYQTPMSGLLLICELVNLSLKAKERDKDRKRFERLCATEVVFKLTKDQAGSWRVLKVHPSLLPKAQEILNKKFGEGSYLILNEMMATNPYAFEL